MNVEQRSSELGGSVESVAQPPPKRQCITDQIAADHLDRRTFIKVSLRELAVYCVYFACLSVAAFGTVNPGMYYYTHVMRKLFVDRTFHSNEGTEISMKDVNTMDHVWSYLSLILVKSIDWNYWYSEHSKVTETLAGDKNILFENRIIGAPRIRQVRVTNHSCVIPFEFKPVFHDCFGPYTSANEEVANLNPKQSVRDSAWLYHSPAQSGSYSFQGTVATYSGGGYYTDLTESSSADESILSTLKSKLWIGRGTRAIFVDITTYNSNTNVFCFMKLVFELPPTGGIVPTAHFNTMKMIRYHSFWGIFALVCEVVIALFTIYFVFEEVLEILNMRSNYFSSWWTYLDLCILSLLIAFLLICLIRGLIIHSALSKNVTAKGSYMSYDRLILIQSIFTYILAFLVFFSALKFVRYLKMNLVMNRLLNIIYESSPALFGFALIFFIIIFAFALLGHLLFGTEVMWFSTVADSIFSLHLMLLGDINYQELVDANRIVGPLFFCTYIFFIFFILLNMFLAIINERFWAKNKQIDLDTEDTLGVVLKQSLQNCLNVFGCKGVVENWRKYDENNRGLIRLNRLKNSLSRSGFSDAEIVAFFEKYEIDEDTLAAENAEELISKLKSDLQGLGAFDSTVQERIMHRIDTIESTMLNIHKKLDNISFRLKMN